MNPSLLAPGVCFNILRELVEKAEIIVRAHEKPHRGKELLQNWIQASVIWIYKKRKTAYS